jgi:hypothetical protein
MTTKRILYYILKCLHANFLNDSFVKRGITISLVMHIAGYILLIGDCTNQLFERSLAE